MQELMPPVNTPDKLFHDGDPTQGIEGTIVTAEWLNNDQSAVRDIQQELINVLAAAAMQPDPATQNQLVTAIQQILGDGISDGALLKENNLSDLVDKAKARTSLELKTAAQKDVVTSMTDTTAGRVPVVGWQGVGGATQIAMGTVSQFLANTDSTKPEYPGNGAGVQSCYAPNRRGQLFLTTDNGLHVRFTLSDSAIDSTTPWARVYTTSYKPSAADVGALPVSSGSLTVDLNTLGRADSRGIYYQATNAGATAANHYPVQVAGTLYVTPSAYGSQQMYVTYTNRIFIRAVTGSFTGTGPWSEWVEMYGPNNRPNSDAVNCIARDGSHIGGFANGDVTRPYMRHTASNAVVTLAKAGDSYTKAESDNGYMPKTSAYTKAESDGRFQPKGSYAAAGVSYTKAESDARYVQDIRLGAVESSNSWAEKSPYIVTGSDKNVGDDYVGHAVRRPLQKLVNGTWINVGW